MPNTPPPSKAPERRRVLIVEDNPFFGACLRSLIDNESDLSVCDVATCEGGISEKIERLRPDVLIIDLALGRDCGLRLGSRLRAEQVFTPIVFISTLRRPTREQLTEIGRSTFVAKSRKPADFLSAVREMLASADGAQTFEEREIGIDATATRA